LVFVEKHVTKDGDIIDVEYERIAPMPSGVAGAASAGAPRCAAPVPSVATAPKARRFVVLVNPAAISATEVTSKAVDAAARTLGVEIAFVSASTPDEINTTFAGIARERPEALFIAGDPFFAGRAVQLANLAMRERLPASFTTRPMVQAGLLMSYGVDIIDSFRQVGAYAGNILRVLSRPTFRSNNRPSFSSSSICRRRRRWG
jgi:hypothetical protein